MNIREVYKKRFFTYFLCDDFVLLDNLDLKQNVLEEGVRLISDSNIVYCIHVVAGWCELQVNNECLCLTQGSFLVLISSCTLFTRAESSDLRFFCILMPKKLEEKLYQELNLNLSVKEYLRKYFTYKRKEYVALNDLRLYRRIKSNLLSDSPIQKSIAYRQIEILLFRDLGFYLEMNPESLNPLPYKEQVLNQFLELLKQYFREEHSLSFYADKLHFTTKYFSSLIKSISGKSASYWIDDMLVTEAKILLRESSYTIREIAAILHFQDQSTFGKFFKKMTGTTPRCYRNIEKSFE